MKESDWKVFKIIKEKAIERFCIMALNEAEEVIKNENDKPHNKYLLLYKLLQNRDKQMQLLFDDHRRSKAQIQLLAIRGEGLAGPDLLEKLSVEFLDATDPIKKKW